MVIAVNARLLLPYRNQGITVFAHEILSRWTRLEPHIQFHLIFDRPYLPAYKYGDNVICHIVSPQARHPLLWYYWFEYALVKLVRKLKADIFYSPEGFNINRVHCKRVITCHDLAFMSFTQGYTKSHLRYYQYFFPRYLEHADLIHCISHYTKEQASIFSKANPAKMFVAYNSISSDVVSDFKDKEDCIKEPYFLYVGAFNERKNLKTLLHAFAIFIKETSPMVKLVLAGKPNQHLRDLLKLAEQLGIRSSVNHIEEFDHYKYQLYHQSLALCYVSYFEGFGIPIVEAFHCGTAVITSAASSMAEISQEAALLVDPKNPRGLSNAMKTIFQNPMKREKLIAAGQLQRKKFDWNKTTSELNHQVKLLL